MFRWFLMLSLLSYSCVAVADFPIILSVKHESTVYTYESPNNGSGPFWNAGFTTIARLGDSVYVSEQETGKDLLLLCNTR